MRIADRPFAGDARLAALAKRAIKFSSPNMQELAQIARSLGYPGPLPTKSMDEYATVDELLADVTPVGIFVNATIDHVLVTLGHHGVAVFRRTGPTVPFFDGNGQYQQPASTSTVSSQGRFYPGRTLAHIVNVSGAGDSFTSGFIVAALSGRSEPVCVNVALEAAGCALQSRGAVAERYFDATHPCWAEQKGAEYRALYN
uniref:Carbohydrate kinase PfkB domain-containing protein n=1 Tax=Anopheles dirus TaxID=7168 RepID=A0A182NFW4_9DIPT